MGRSFPFAVLAQGAHTRAAIMSKRVRTGVSPLGIALTFVMVGMTPRIAHAAPIELAPGTSLTLAGDFRTLNDVALFQFTLGEGAYNFSAMTDSLAAGGFDPFLALYFGTQLYEFLDADGVLTPAVSDDREPGVDVEAFLPLVLTRPGDYTLALAYSGNEAKPTLGFTWDDFPDVMGSLYPDVTCDPGGPSFGPLCGGPSYALTLALNPVDSSPVPEPGTLSLMALGSLATACLRRRRRTVVTTPR
jgi:PEP-CTERM motif